MLYFKSILPPRIADVVSCNNIAIDTKSVSYENRIKTFFLRVFGKDKGFIEDEAYWSLLWKMLSDPNNRYGIVAIDGYSDDPLGKEDYALFLNMKEPRLRARNIHNLGTIYMRFDTDGKTSYYNSTTDYFDFLNQVPARHPHISNGEPCLGNYSTRLSKSQYEGNPIMWLKDINQFLNTWNANSAYYNLNTTPEKMIFYPQNTKLKPREISSYKYFGILNSVQSDHRTFALEALRDELIWKVKSTDRRSEFKVAGFVASLCGDMYDKFAGNSTDVYKNSKHAEYIEDFRASTGKVARLDSRGWEILNIGANVEMEQPRFIFRSESGHIKFVKLSSPYLNYITSSYFDNARSAMKSMGYTIDYVIKSPIAATSIQKYIIDIAPIILEKYVKEYVPIIIEQNKVLADLTVKNKTKRRLTCHNPEIYDADLNPDTVHAIEIVLKDYFDHYNNIKRNLKRTFIKLLDEKFSSLDVDALYDKKTEEVFEVKEYPKQYGRPGSFDNVGYYMQHQGIYDKDRYKEHLKTLGIEQYPKTFKELIITYENLKHKVHVEMLTAKQETINKQIIKEGGMLRYGSKANNTQEDSTQVPLSFD
tara:strand:- start:1843 stop:3612 length:1770 start_codon:yes stop_codon:yes gene_type:complete